MKKLFLLTLAFAALVSCGDDNDLKQTGSTLYTEIVSPANPDTSAIRFVFENEGNSKMTGKVYCSKDTMFSSGEYFKLDSNPLKFYFKSSLDLFEKTLVYFEVNPLPADTFSIQLTFPGLVNNKKDTLVYKAFKTNLP